MIKWLNPKYENLRPYFEQPQLLAEQGQIIHNGRNKLYVTDVEDTTICIKQYDNGQLWRNIIYRHFHSPAAERAMQHSLELIKAGFSSPEPIAYIQFDNFLCLTDSYYICLYQTGRTLYQWGEKSLSQINDYIDTFAQFTARLHEAGFLLNDYTPGNIMITTEGFTLIDTNRMQRREVSIKTGLKNMAGLWLQPEVAERLATTYCHARKVSDTEHYVALMHSYRNHFWKRFSRRHHLNGEIIHRNLDGTAYHFKLSQSIQ